jgi:hypothetical protein
MQNQMDFGAYGAPRSKGLAITSLVLGILSLLTCSLFGIGAIISIVLGVLALNKANNQPDQYGGKGLAIAGIVLSAVSFMSGIIVAIAIPNLVRSQQAAREVAAIREVQAIGIAELQYSAFKGRGKFTDLRTLGVEGLIDSQLASGEKFGYLFSAQPVTGTDTAAMYEVTAKPVSSGTFGTGTRSFYTNENNIIYESEGGLPPSASPQDRVPKNGKPIFR